MHRREFLTAAAGGLLGASLGRAQLGVLGRAHAQVATPLYPLLVLQLRGGIDPAMHLVAVPDGPYGNVTVSNRFSGTTGIKTSSTGIRYFTGAVCPTGATEFEPYLSQLALLRAHRAAGAHNFIASLWFGSRSFMDTPWANYVASRFRAAGLVVPKPNVVTYPTQTAAALAIEPYYDFVAYNNKSPNPACAAERILSLNGHFDSIARGELPVFAQQAPSYALAQALDRSTYSPLTQPGMVAKFGSANAAADTALKSAFDGPTWPPPPEVMSALGISSISAVPDVTLETYLPNRVFALAYQSLAKNLSHVITLTVDPKNWDSHADNYARQLAAGNAFWPALGRLCNLMKATPSPIVAGKTLFDTTNICLLTEMGRTTGAGTDPDAESANGTAHWNGAAMAAFLGGRFKRGIAIGGIDSSWNAMPVNPLTGQATGGSVMGFDNVIATAIKSSGVDPAGWTAARPIDALLDMSL